MQLWNCNWLHRLKKLVLHFNIAQSKQGIQPKVSLFHGSSVHYVGSVLGLKGERILKGHFEVVVAARLWNVLNANDIRKFNFAIAFRNFFVLNLDESLSRGYYNVAPSERVYLEEGFLCSFVEVTTAAVSDMVEVWGSVNDYAILNVALDWNLVSIHFNNNKF